MRLKSFLGLSLSLAKAEFKLKNEGSYFGIIWYILGPILTFLLLLGIFSDRLGNNIAYYPLYLLLGIVMFNLFQNTTTEATKAISIHRGIIKSIKFPLEALIGSITLKAIFSHIFEILIFFIILKSFGLPLVGILFYPLILGVFCIFIFGVSLIFSALNVYFVDLENIWVFASRVLWFATPIFYEIGNQTKLFLINLFNPLYFFIEISRSILIYNKIPDTWVILGSLGYTLISIIIGFLVFNRLKHKFAEMV